MDAVEKLLVLYELWNWAIKTQGLTPGSALLQALPFYPGLKAWLEANEVDDEDWLLQIWNYTWNDGISWQENLARMTELRPIIGTIDTNTGATLTNTENLATVDDQLTQVYNWISEMRGHVNATESTVLNIFPVLTQLYDNTDDHLDQVEAHLTATDTYVEAHRIEDRDTILDRIQSNNSAIGTLIQNAADWLRGLTFEYCQTNRLLLESYVNEKQILSQTQRIAHFEALAARHDETVTAIGAALTDINAHTDEVRTSINADTQVHTEAAAQLVNDHTDEVRTSLNADLDVKLEDVRANLYTQTIASHEFVVDAVNTAANGVIDAGNTAANNVIAAVGNKVDEARLVVDAIKGTTDNLRDLTHADIEHWTGERAGWLNDTINIRGYAIEAKVDENRLVLNAIDARVVALGEGLNPIGGGDPIAETAFDGVFVWDQQADYYEVAFDVVPPGRPIMPLGDESYMPHLAWCAFKHFSAFERGPQLEFSLNLVHPGKLRASGILIYARPGTTGVIRAYDKT